MADRHPGMGPFRLARRCVPPLIYLRSLPLHFRRAANLCPCRYPVEEVAGQGIPLALPGHENKTSDAVKRIACERDLKAKHGGP